MSEQDIDTSPTSSLQDLEVEVNLCLGSTLVGSKVLKDLTAGKTLEVGGLDFPKGSVHINDEEFAQVELVNVDEQTTFRILSTSHTDNAE